MNSSVGRRLPPEIDCFLITACSEVFYSACILAFDPFTVMFFSTLSESEASDKAVLQA